jgi:hypothetical protein
MDVRWVGLHLHFKKCLYFVFNGWVVSLIVIK